MANLSNYLANATIDAMFRGITYSPPATLYVALATATPTAATTGSTLAEVAGGSYARQAVVSGTAAWYSTNGTTSGASTGSTETTSNVAAVTFPVATGNWGTVSAIVITDSLATLSGAALYWTTLSVNKVVTSGDTFSFATGSLSVNIT